MIGAQDAHVIARQNLLAELIERFDCAISLVEGAQSVGSNQRLTATETLLAGSDDDALDSAIDRKLIEIDHARVVSLVTA